LLETLSTTYTDDRHFAAYAPVQISDVHGYARLKTEALDHQEHPKSLIMTLLVFDFDGPNHLATPEWRADAEARIPDGALWYPTAGGFRVIFALTPHTTIANRTEAAGWKDYYLTCAAALKRTTGLEADLTCNDAFRLFRLPRVQRRDGKPCPVSNTWIPSPPTLWDDSILLESDFPTVKTRVTARGEPGCDVEDTLLFKVLAKADWEYGEQRGEWLDILCPWHAEHSVTDQVDSSTSIKGNDEHHLTGPGVFRCLHSHCRERTVKDVLAHPTFAPIVADFDAAKRAKQADWSAALEGTSARVANDVTQIEIPLDPTDIRALVGKRRSKSHTESNAILKRVADGYAVGLEAIPAAIEALCEGFPNIGDTSLAGAMLAAASHDGADLAQLTDMVSSHRAAKQSALAVASNVNVSTVGLLTRLQDFVNRIDGIRFNELTGTIEHNGAQWSDEDTSSLRVNCEQKGVSDPEKPLSADNVERAVRIAARKNKYHPVRDYLEALPAWDGEPRLEKLFPNYMRCEDSALNRALGLCFAIAAVARLYAPGCKHDLMPILHGEQGCRKSSAIKALVGGEPAYSDAKMNLDHRADACLLLHECWVYECAELHSFAKADQNVIKNLITQTTDRYLPPYGRNRVSAERASVMIGTTNQDECLKDTTGNRRHPVVRCLATEADPIDTDAIHHDRGALWAEALHRYLAGEQWYLNAELAAALEISNERHVAAVSDTWEDVVLGWLAAPTKRTRETYGHPTPWGSDSVSVGELLEHAIGIPVDRQDRPAQTRMGILARKLKLEAMPNPGRRGGVRYRVRTADVPQEVPQDGNHR
jgi:putative DNA primase/helicase